MPSCDDLGRDLDGLNRRIRELERRVDSCCGSSGGGGGGTPQNRPIDEESIIKKAVERVYKDERWASSVRVLKKIILGAGA